MLPPGDGEEERGGEQPAFGVGAREQAVPMLPHGKGDDQRSSPNGGGGKQEG